MSIPANWRPNGDPVANPRADTTCSTGRSASQSSAVMRWMVVRSIVARTRRRASSSRASSRIETPQSRPQLVVRVPRLLRLQGDEVLDGGFDREVHTLQEELARERAIERAAAQDGIGHFESLRNGLDAGASHYGRNGIRRANTEGHRGPDRSRRAGKPGRS